MSRDQVNPRLLRSQNSVPVKSYGRFLRAGIDDIGPNIVFALCLGVTSDCSGVVATPNL